MQTLFFFKKNDDLEVYKSCVSLVTSALEDLTFLASAGTCTQTHTLSHR